jgi:hypothetical protein
MHGTPKLQTVGGDLFSCQGWTTPFESAYSQVAKIALVNALNPSSVCQMLFGRKLLNASYTSRAHGRSFLTDIWATPGAQGATGRSVLPGFLTRLCGSWATDIAGDVHLRLCRECADVGYHCLLFQIDALQACPIHGEPLIEACSHCSSPTPRYALTDSAFRTPMQCSTCGVGYGRAWSGTANFDKWTGPGDIQPLLQLVRRLQTWQTLDIAWPTLSRWTVDPASASPAERRIDTFHALASLTTSAPVQVKAARVRTQSFPCNSTASRRWFGPELERTAIYKAIRRHIIRRWRLGRYRRGLDLDDCFHVHLGNEAIFPRRSRCPPELHAFALWTQRCESTAQQPSLSRWLAGKHTARAAAGLKLRAGLSSWPTEVNVADAAWGHFVWSSFLEDLWTARCWQLQAQPLGDPLEQDDRDDPLLQWRRAQFLGGVASWTPKLSPLIELFPSAITQYTWQQEKGDRRLILVTIHRPQGG